MNCFRRLPSVLLSACLIVATVKTLAATNWKNVAINGGGFVSGLLFHPAEANLLYARTDVGGAYRWDDPNHRWIPLNDDLGGLSNEFMHLGVLSFAIDPNDAGYLYLACGQYTWNFDWNPTGIILRSTDRGATWARTTLTVRCGGNEDGRNTGERLQVDPNDGRVLFFGTNQDGLWQSTDRGANWTKVTTFPATSCTLVLFDKTTGSAGHATQTIYVGVNSTSTTSLYRSIDGGATWSAVPNQPVGFMPHHADIGYAPDGRTLYLAYSNALGPNGASSGAVWKMNLATGAWSYITPPSGACGYGGISVAASDPHSVVVSTLDRWGPHDEIYRSTDSGATWRGILQSGSLDTSAAPWAAASTPHWTADVKVDPFNAARALFVTGYGLFASDNVAAATPVWVFRNAGLEETVPTMFVSPPSGPPLVSVVLDLDGFRHDNPDAVPANRVSPLEGSNTSIDFAEASPAVMARTFYTATRGAWSANGGTAWTLFGSAPSATGDGGTIAVSADGTRFVWTQSTMVPYYSTNHGGTWTPSSGAPTGLAPVADRVNSAKFYVYDKTAGRVYVSTDGGVTFTAAASVPGGGSPMRAVPGFEGNLWLAAWGSGLLRSADSGASFTGVSSAQEAYAVGFGQAPAGQTYPAIFIWGKVANVIGFFRSDDVGATWIRINDDQHQFGYINWMAGDPRVFGRVYLATSGRGVVYGDSASAPAITTQPSNQTATAGGSASFTAAASGAPAPALRWQVSTNGGSNWTDLANSGPYSGVTTGTLTITGAAVSMNNYQYRCLASNSAQNDVASNPAALTVSAPAVKPWVVTSTASFQGGSKAGLLWFNATTSETAIWLMNGLGSTAGAAYAPGADWSVAGTGDFDGDGKTDLLWRNRTTGGAVIWFMDGIVNTSGKWIYDSGTTWIPPKLADFNGDGKTDILWYNTVTGEYGIWLMNGSGALLGATGFAVGPEWQVGQVADFDGDGRADLLWRNSATGGAVIWFMNGTQIANSKWIYDSGTSWTPARVADFNGDGKADILWQNIDGSKAIWLMNGMGELLGAGGFSVGTGWELALVADFDGDGKADILWRNSSTGGCVLWTMNGTGAASYAWVYDSGLVWTPIRAADFNGDGKADILWQSTDGSLAIWLMNGGASLGGAQIY